MGPPLVSGGRCVRCKPRTHKNLQCRLREVHARSPSILPFFSWPVVTPFLKRPCDCERSRRFSHHRTTRRPEHRTDAFSRRSAENQGVCLQKTGRKGEAVPATDRPVPRAHREGDPRRQTERSAGPSIERWSGCRREIRRCSYRAAAADRPPAGPDGAHTPAACGTLRSRCRTART